MKFGIKEKLNASILVVVLIVLGLIVGFFSINLRKQAKTANLKLHDNICGDISSKAAASFNIDLGVTRALATSYQGFADQSEEKIRDFYQRFLEQSMVANPNYLALWISLELKEFDPQYTKDYGRVTWLYDRLGDSLQFQSEDRDLDPNNLSPQYQDIKRTKRESLIDPYWYVPGYAGSRADSLLETTVAVPVFRNNTVVGLAGIDFTLKQIDELSTYVNQQDTIKSIIISNNGTIVAHENSDFIGSNLSETGLFDEYANEILHNIKSGQEYNITKLHNGTPHYFTFHPIEVGNSQTPWSVCVSVPVRDILSDANRVFWRSLIIGLLGLILLGTMVFIISTRIIRPIETTTQQLSKLSKGHLDESESYINKSKDEIGAMTRALSSLQRRLLAVVNFAQAIGEGRLDVPYPYKSENDKLGTALSRMQQNLIDLDAKNSKQDWLKTGLNGLNRQIRGDKDLDDLVKQMISYIAKYLNAPAGALFIADDSRRLLKLVSGYAFSKRKELNAKIEYGEGLVGQCLVEKEMILLTDVPDDYFPIKSATGSTNPKNVIVYPCMYNDEVLGVIELACMEELSDIQFDFLEAAAQTIAIGLHSAFAKDEMKVLLAKTLEQKEELQAQEEELREANKELEKQTQSLRNSEASLQAQQEELRVTNQELEKNAQLLEEQSERIKEKNSALEVSRKEIEKKAKEVELASKYKSEFLANMSHELRTPLNSMLILSQTLAENTEGNLNASEIESAEIIYKSGRDLLNLINEVLDLSKVEAGKMQINTDIVDLNAIVSNMKNLFKGGIEEKGLAFKTEMMPDTPMEIFSDQQRIEQIVKNLISNSLKFTSQGSISLRFRPFTQQHTLTNPELKTKKCLAIDVEDTGIGIPKEKQHLIFEAFQQEDGSTSRKYGGTGLGLSISREMAKLLGGELQMTSEQGKGSVFSLILPVELATDVHPPTNKETNKEINSDQTASEKVDIQRDVTKSTPVATKKTATEPVTHSFVPDDRGKLSPEDHVMVIIEDDPEFAKILVHQSNKKGFKCLTAGTGEDGLWLVSEHHPSAIILDIKLPGMNGWEVLDQLKKNTKTRHIPVHMMSANEETLEAYQKGAIGYLTKPVDKRDLTQALEKIDGFIDKKLKKLLIVEDDPMMSKTIHKIIRGKDVTITEAPTGKDCLKEINKGIYDCVILDLGLPDMDGFDLLEKIQNLKIEQVPPIIIYTGREISREENAELQKFTNSIIIKGVRSEERLLDETALFLHRIVNDLSEQQQKILRRLYNGDDIFQDKKVLLADDDMRNIFALSKLFEEKGMEVIKAENGLKALEAIQKIKNIDLVLMDIMMPEMDGYDAIQEIRKLKDFEEIPIIALTAKAMKEDKQKCLDAGASDYITKPVDIQKLLSLVRVWLSK